MTGLGAIWAAGTICTVGETGRGLIMGQHPIPPIHLPLQSLLYTHPLTAQLHPYLNNTAA